MINKTPDFSIIPTAILNDKRITFRALKVYIAIKSFMNKETHECFPSRQIISKMTDIPITRISVETENLEKMGWIKKIGNGGRSNPCVYTILTPQLTPETVTESVMVSKPETVTELITVTKSETVTDLDETVTELSGNGYRIERKTVTELVTGIEHTIEQTKNRPVEQTMGETCAPEPISAPPNPKPTKEPKSSGARGTRWGDEQTVPQEWKEWAKINHPLVNTELQATQFENYWSAKAGSGAIKMNWEKTWRNWILNSQQFSKPILISNNQSSNTGGYNGTKRENTASRAAKWTVPGKAVNQRPATPTFEDGFSGRTLEHVEYCAE